MKDKDKSSSTQNIAICAIKKFCEACNIDVSFQKVRNIKSNITKKEEEENEFFSLFFVVFILSAMRVKPLDKRLQVIRTVITKKYSYSINVWLDVIPVFFKCLFQSEPRSRCCIPLC
jgi:hypothetical protein